MPAFTPGSFDTTSSLGAMAGMLTFRGDPAIIQMQGSIMQALAFAESEALRRQRDILTEYGDPEVTAGVLGKKDPTVKASETNPFSIQKQLAKDYQLQTRAMGEGLNKENLWFSGEHERQLKLGAENYLGQQYQASRSLQQDLGDIAANLQAARIAAADQKAQATLQAQQNRYTF